MSEVCHEQTSHLSTLIARVREDEVCFGCSRKERLVNIAEYLLSWRGKFSGQEYSEAIKILAKYHLAKLANVRRPRQSWKLINAELAKPYRARCQRCGLPLSNEISIEVGHGPVCRRKLGISSCKQKQPILEPDQP